IIGSQKQVSCVYAPDAPGAPQDFYTGSITKFGLDLGVTGASVMGWGVFSDTIGGPGFLAGDYVGATREATVPGGLGAKVLVGGARRQCAGRRFQPDGRAAAGLGDRPGRAQSCGRRGGSAFAPRTLTTSQS